MPPAFKQPGVVLFKSSGVVAYGTLCCCYLAPALPCPFCNANQTPNGIELTVEAADLEDWTCGGICTSLAGTYILTKVEDADCYYSYCEDDPCNDASPFGEPYFLKILVFINDFETAEVNFIFASTATTPACNSVVNGLRLAIWRYDSGLPGTTWNCLNDLDDDAAAVTDDPSIDIGFCHAGGAVHVRALN